MSKAKLETTKKLTVIRKFKDKFTDTIYNEKDILKINPEHKDIKATKIEENVYEISTERAMQLKQTEYVK